MYILFCCFGLSSRSENRGKHPPFSGQAERVHLLKMFTRLARASAQPNVAMGLLRSQAPAAAAVFASGRRSVARYGLWVCYLLSLSYFWKNGVGKRRRKKPSATLFLSTLLRYPSVVGITGLVQLPSVPWYAIELVVDVVAPGLSCCARGCNLRDQGEAWPYSGFPLLCALRPTPPSMRRDAAPRSFFSTAPATMAPVPEQPVSTALDTVVVDAAARSFDAAVAAIENGVRFDLIFLSDELV